MAAFSGQMTWRGRGTHCGEAPCSSDPRALLPLACLLQGGEGRITSGEAEDQHSSSEFLKREPTPTRAKVQ